MLVEAELPYLSICIATILPEADVPFVTFQNFLLFRDLFEAIQPSDLGGYLNIPISKPFKAKYGTFTSTKENKLLLQFKKKNLQYIHTAMLYMVVFLLVICIQ